MQLAAPMRSCHRAVLVLQISNARGGSKYAGFAACSLQQWPAGAFSCSQSPRHLWRISRHPFHLANPNEQLLTGQAGAAERPCKRWRQMPRLCCMQPAAIGRRNRPQVAVLAPNHLATFRDYPRHPFHFADPNEQLLTGRAGAAERQCKRWRRIPRLCCMRPAAMGCRCLAMVSSTEPPEGLTQLWVMIEFLWSQQR